MTVSICYVNYLILVQNVHRWLTHVPAVACGSLSQHCWLPFLVRLAKPNQLQCIFKPLFLAVVCSLWWDSGIALKRNNPVDWGRANWKALIHSYDVIAKNKWPPIYPILIHWIITFVWGRCWLLLIAVRLGKLKTDNGKNGRPTYLSNNRRHFNE